jgi:hypothetical protein
MDANQTIKKAFDENPDVRIVLDIATRARDVETRELPREIGAATEVVAIPTNPQCAV